MPIYEYECHKCGVMELMKKITDKPLRRCPRCGGKVRKLVSQTSFHLKGSGWYVTDYGKGKAARDKKSDAPEQSGSCGAETAKPEKAVKEVKPAEKSSPASSKSTEKSTGCSK